MSREQELERALKNALENLRASSLLIQSHVRLAKEAVDNDPPNFAFALVNLKQAEHICKIVLASFPEQAAN